MRTSNRTVLMKSWNSRPDAWTAENWGRRAAVISARSLPAIPTLLVSTSGRESRNSAPRRQSATIPR